MFTNLGAEVNERIGHKFYLKTEFDNKFVHIFNQRRNTSLNKQFTLLSGTSCLSGMYKLSDKKQNIQNEEIQRKKK